MNRQEIIAEIKRLNEEEKIPITSLVEAGFIYQPNYAYLKEAFYKNNLSGKERWHQLVRFALSNPDEFKHMYDRLLNLLLEYRKSYRDYFELKTEVGTYHFPDLLADLNRMLILYKEYFEIYRDILNQIHFDHPMKNYSGASIRGQINWKKTLQHTMTEFPIWFETSSWFREFDTPENILLLLCAVWMNRESRRLLEINFIDPLRDEQKQILIQVMDNTQKILLNFPFNNVTSSSKRFFELSYDDKRIISLIGDVKYRIGQSIVQNKKYVELLNWIQKFHELNIRMVSKSTITRFPLETLTNLDTIYEAWIFFEMIDFFKQKNLLVTVELNKKPYFFEFIHAHKKITVYYEKPFPFGEKHAWAVKAVPDFTVMCEDVILAIFDAKNYGVDEDEKSIATNKMLAYMTNLDTSFGGLFFPKYAENEFYYPRKQDSSRFHHNLKLVHYKMEPRDSPDAINVKNKTLLKIFSEIIRIDSESQVTYNVRG